MVYKTAE